MLDAAQLPAAIAALLPCLVVPQQALRAAALRLLCCFDQPPFLGAAAGAAAAEPRPQQQQEQQQQQHPERAAFEGMRCDALCVLRDMHTQPCSVQAGRSWSVALERMTNHLEYARIPAALLPALTAGLLGVLHIRCA
jgi:U3 small nucleolar RNA-associated protein 20